MVERGVKQEQGDLFLPAGFRFYPTDEEIITSYLLQKFLNHRFEPRAIAEVNLNKCEPWDLPSKAKMGEKEWYFFCHKDMKYPTGTRANRATKEGYWKATGKDREIFKPASAAGDGGGRRELVGMKKTLVFYMGRAPRGSKTNWVMHEFRLEGESRHHAELRFSPKDEWVVCKVFHKNNGEDRKAAAAAVEYSAGTPNVSSISVDATGDDGDDFLDSMIKSMYFNSTSSSLPDTTTPMAPPYNAAAMSNVGSFVDLLPNYTTFSDKTSGNLHPAAAVADSTVPTSSGDSPSWNLLQTSYGMGSYNRHHQAMVTKALGGFIQPNFSGGLPSSSSVNGISQQNSLWRGTYATNHLTSSAAAATATTATIMGQASTKNWGA